MLQTNLGLEKKNEKKRKIATRRSRVNEELVIGTVRAGRE